MTKWELVRNHLDEKYEEYSVLILDNKNNRADYWGWCGYAQINISLAVLRGAVYKTVVEDTLIISTKEVDITKSNGTIVSFVDGTCIYYDREYSIEYVNSKECSDLYRAVFLHDNYPEIDGYINRDNYDDEEEYKSEWWDALYNKYTGDTEEADELLQLNDILDEVKIILE